METIVATAVGGGWLLLFGWTGFLAFGAFLLAGYATVRWHVATKGTSSSATVAALLMAFGLFFVKIIAPLVAGSFANPGGFELALPLGLSYLAIRIVDLLISLRARAIAPPSFLEYASFMLYPAALAAGPIMTYGDFRKSRIESWSIVDWAAGTARWSIGVGKKLIADAYVAPALAASYSEYLLTPEQATFKLVAPMLLLNFAFIYLDFSAFADLALGSGRAAGRSLPENFNWPLFRSSLRGYWQNWHMTLSNWVMRRVYFPTFIESRSIALSATSSMVLIGLWHFPSTGWLLWALHHALGLTVNSWFTERWSGREQKRPAGLLHRSISLAWLVAGWCMAMSWVALGYVFTLFDSGEHRIGAFLALLRFSGGSP